MSNFIGKRRNGFGETGADTERSIARPGKDHGADFRIGLGSREGLSELLIHFQRQRIELVWSRKANGRDMAGALEFDRHVSLSCRR